MDCTSSAVVTAVQALSSSMDGRQNNPRAAGTNGGCRGICSIPQKKNYRMIASETPEAHRAEQATPLGNLSGQLFCEVGWSWHVWPESSNNRC